MKRNLDQLQKKISYEFKDRSLLVQALTHSSYAYEKANIHALPEKNNELLEFLGDSVVGLVASEYFFSNFPALHEGQLSKWKAYVTSTNSLADFARSISLDKYLFLGKGEEKSGGRKKPSILAGVVEALAGAMFIDGGLPPVKLFLTKYLNKKSEALSKKSFDINNYKSALQEHLLKSGLILPDYCVVSETGPPHKRKFTVEVLLHNKTLARASGLSKKAAEQKAARKALVNLIKNKVTRLSDESFVIKNKTS